MQLIFFTFRHENWFLILESLQFDSVRDRNDTSALTPNFHDRAEISWDFGQIRFNEQNVVNLMIRID